MTDQNNNTETGRKPDTAIERQPSGGYFKDGYNFDEHDRLRVPLRTGGAMGPNVAKAPDGRDSVLYDWDGFGASNDILIGKDGNDEIHARWGNDDFEGGKGDDIIHVGGVEDRFHKFNSAHGTGGEGKDTFIKHGNKGSLTVYDFSPAEDTLKITGLSPDQLKGIDVTKIDQILRDNKVSLKQDDGKTKVDLGQLQAQIVGGAIQISGRSGPSTP